MTAPFGTCRYCLQAYDPYKSTAARWQEFCSKHCQEVGAGILEATPI